MSAAGIERRRLPLLALASILAGIASPAIGQVVLPPVVTDIVPDFAPGRDLGTLVTSNVGVHTIDGGTLAGANLFHSFASFSLAQAETARWVQTTADPASIANVINRVTGGSTSYISGTIDSTAIPNADFWFVNPAGIVFGQGALVDVPAAAHFSTAGRLRFADGESFEIATPDGSTLSMANPVAFGFLGGQGDIVFDQASFSVPAGLSLTGANLSFSNSTVGGGAVIIGAVGDDAAEVALDGSADTALSGQLALDAFSGVLSVSDGLIAINAGHLALSNNSSIVSANDASTGAGLTITANTVELDGNSHLSTYSQFVSTADGSDIRIAAGSVALRGGSYIDTLTQGAGRGGDISIAAGSLDLSGASYLLARTTTLGTGDSGDIFLDAGSLTLGGASMVRSDTTGQGKGGCVGNCGVDCGHGDRYSR